MPAPGSSLSRFSLRFPFFLFAPRFSYFRAFFFLLFLRFRSRVVPLSACVLAFCRQTEQIGKESGSEKGQKRAARPQWPEDALSEGSDAARRGPPPGAHCTAAVRKNAG